MSICRPAWIEDIDDRVMRYTRGSPIRLAAGVPKAAPAVQYGGIYETAAGGFCLIRRTVGRRSPNAPRQGRRPMPYPLRMGHPKEAEASR